MDIQLFEKILLEEQANLLDLHTAASIGCEERVVEIIENVDHKVVINQRNSSGWTPLMYAACCANLRIVALLLEEGALTDIKNTQGHTAMILASKCGSTDAVNMLIHSNASINNKDYTGCSALSYAAAFGHRSVVQLLIENGAHPDKGDQLRGLVTSALPKVNQDTVVKDLSRLDICPNGRSKSPHVPMTTMKNTSLLQVDKAYSEKAYTHGTYNAFGRNDQSDLEKLLNELKLSKYYHVFESHGIDLNMFWLLSEEDLKEMGIQLLGPRKRISTAIADWYKSNLTQGYSDDPAFTYKLILEYRKLQQKKEELESALSRESELRKASENNLNEGIKSLSKFSDAVQRTMAYTVILEEKLKQSQVNLKKLFCSTPEVNWPTFRNDIAIPLIDGMDNLLDEIHRYTCMALQQTTFRKN